MAARDSWATQASGPTGIIDVEDARVALGAAWMPGSSGIVARSGFRPGPGTSPGLVTPTGTPDANVHVAPFQLVLQTVRATTGGPYLITLDATANVNVLSTPADPTNPRNDLIIAQQSDTFYGDGVSTWVIRQVVGTPAGSPADPAVSGSGDYVPLARVRVNASATTITGANITDLRSSGHAKSLTGGLYTVCLGGILPVASAAERNALTGVYPGLTVWRVDLNRIEMYDGAVWRSTTPYQARQTLGGSAASVVFSGIPSTLRRLELQWTARGDTAATTIDVRMQINGVAVANYLTQIVQGSGASASALLNPGSPNSSQVGIMTAASASANVFGSGVIELQSWDGLAGRSLGFTTRSEALAGSGFTQHGGGIFVGGPPYTSVTLFPSAGNFVTGSDFQLMGWDS